MKRLIGIKKVSSSKPAPPPPPGISDCISIVDKRADEIDKKVAKCREQLKQLHEQIKKARAGSAKQQLMQKATRVMQQMKAYEAQTDGLRSQSFNMDQATNALQTAQETKVIVSAIQSGVKELKRAQKDLDIEEIEDLQSQMEDLVVVSEEIQDSMAHSYNMPEIDEDELQAEFDALGDELKFDEATACHDDAITSAGPGSGSGPGPNAMCNLPELTIGGTSLDEFGLPILQLPGPHSGTLAEERDRI